MAGDRDAEVDPRFDPAFQRGYDPAVHSGRAHDEPAAEALALPAHNPFRVALLVASVVAISAGALMIWNRVGEDVFYGGFSGANQGLLFRTQLIAALPVPLLGGGLLGVILWLAIGAIAHRERTDD
jgi:hypothetical protein